MTDCARQAKEHAEEFFKTWAQDILPSSKSLAFTRPPSIKTMLALWMNTRCSSGALRCLKRLVKSRRLKSLIKIMPSPRNGSAIWLNSRALSKGRAAVQHLADIGIILVIERALQKTYLDGAAMLDGNSPVIGANSSP